MSSSERNQLDPHIDSECRDLLSRFKTLILATASNDGAPDASTTPFLLQQGSFYILVSELAKHTGHLLQNQRCVALFLEDESNAANLFARKRLTIECEAILRDRNSSVADSIFDQMAQRFGPVLAMLRQLPDFHLIELQPKRCSYVRGFGQAFRFEADQHPTLWS
jgi:heme iron utilization protein